MINGVNLNNNLGFKQQAYSAKKKNIKSSHSVNSYSSQIAFSGKTGLINTLRAGILGIATAFTPACAKDMKPDVSRRFGESFVNAVKEESGIQKAYINTFKNQHSVGKTVVRIPEKPSLDKIQSIKTIAAGQCTEMYGAGRKYTPILTEKFRAKPLTTDNKRTVYGIDVKCYVDK